MTVETDQAEVESAEADFPQVAKLGKNNEGRVAAEYLSGVCAELREVEVDIAVQRIKGVDSVVTELSFPIIERLIAPERVLAELEDVRMQPVRRLQARRNQVALLPLFITWVTLAVAVLVRGSADELLGPVFAGVALVDAVLIGLVVLYTRQAHKLEIEAAESYDLVAGQLDKAITYLAIAAESEAVASPLKAEDWAESARRVIQDAMRQTTQLSEANQQVVTDAAEAVKTARDEAAELIKQLAEQSRTTLESLQQANEQMVTRVIKESVTVLNQAVTEDRSLINDQMAPLVDKFRSGVEDFAKSFDTYQSSTHTFVAVTSDLGAAAKVLSDSAKSYTDIAGSIDSHLQTIEGSQDTFISRVTESVQNMGTAADAMETVSKLLRDRLREDLERITRQLDTSSERLATVDVNLVATAGALSSAASQLKGAASAFDSATRSRRKWFRRGKGSAKES